MTPLWLNCFHSRTVFTFYIQFRDCKCDYDGEKSDNDPSGIAIYSQAGAKFGYSYGWRGVFTAIILIAEIFIPYKTYSKILKFLTFSLFLYILTAFLVVHSSDWTIIAKSTFLPHFELDKTFVLMIVAVLGTTISAYLFFWQTSEEVEEEVRDGKIKEMGQP